MRIDSATVGMESARVYDRVSYYGTAASISTMEGIKPSKGSGETSGSFGESLQRQNEQVRSGEYYSLERGRFSRILTGLEEETEETDTVDSEGLLGSWKEKLASEKTQKSDLNAQMRLSTYQQFRVACLEFLLRMLFREKGVSVDYDGEDLKVTESAYPSEGYGMSYTEDLVMVSGTREQEETKVSMGGIVKTGDGRELSFNLDLTMSRTFEESYRETYHREIVQDADLWDPLVINLDTPAAALSDQSFYFDLDTDGEEDKIAMLCEGSGFLALDKNGDGRIGDGSELFGAVTGDGFKELARYDLDGDGFIDEDDPIWEKLRVWAKDSSGKDVLYTLAQAGVGAIYTGGVDSEFGLKDEVTNATRGVVRKTGFYLKEQGGMGTVQHVDIALA
ncbi:MAG: hypothetical protein K6A92_03385 [Lachnospiraceae bacterium]|nr:hypothetical protein [Lachnospiraceae bacterium]